MSRFKSGLFALTALAAIVCPAAGTFAAESPAAQAKAAATKGLAFLKTKQQPDGGWTASPREPIGISALVLRSFAQDKETGANADFVKKGYGALLKVQKPDGGIYTEGLNTYNTAISVSALAAAKDPELKDEIDKAVAYLKGIQYKGDEKDPSVGGVSYGGVGRDGKPQRADLSNTQTYLEALKDAGLKPDDPAFKEAVKFVSRAQNRSESNDQPWAGDDGGFIYTPANGGSSNAGEFTGPDGKKLFRSYGLMTYAGLKSMIYAGLTKDDPRVKAAWDWIQKNWTLDENPGMRFAGEDKAKDGLFYYYHTVAAALHAYGEPVIVDAKGNKHDWRAELTAKLAGLQNADGSWTGGRAYMESNPVLATSFVVLSLQFVEKDLAERPVK